MGRHLWGWGRLPKLDWCAGSGPRPTAVAASASYGERERRFGAEARCEWRCQMGRCWHLSAAARLCHGRHSRLHALFVDRRKSPFSFHLGPIRSRPGHRVPGGLLPTGSRCLSRLTGFGNWRAKTLVWQRVVFGMHPRLNCSSPSLCRIFLLPFAIPKLSGVRPLPGFRIDGAVEPNHDRRISHQSINWDGNGGWRAAGAVAAR